MHGIGVATGRIVPTIELRSPWASAPDVTPPPPTSSFLSLRWPSLDNPISNQIKFGRTLGAKIFRKAAGLGTLEFTLGPLVRSESQSRQGSRSVDFCRDADLSPAVCIGSSRRFGFASLRNGVTAQQEMRGQTITGSQTKDDLSHLGSLFSWPQRDWSAPSRKQLIIHPCQGLL